ncbi:PREDICTED: partitioning defective 3 homolog [Priapulus caudatus]|uniref:Partitioning defective 3 homolog n=1 Tax=Priapulus caudatus TaxID=37621 RepID=A0ABM1EN03_PRICU|nr:PREDICTED: partitioning defective 3 homolog [Priapulus caudatus]
MGQDGLLAIGGPRGTTRPGSNGRLYIRTSCRREPRIGDGRLKPWEDRFMEVNGIEMDGQSLSRQAVQILRQTSGMQSLTSSSHARRCFDTTLPRELVALDSVPAGTLSCRPAEKLGEDVLLTPGLQKEILTFEIAVNDTGSAGLGVSVKGKTTNTPNGPKDLGIFIKCVIHGGAAHKDGRLRTNDQLLCVNEQGLVGKTNDAAMSGLRHAMQGGPGDAAAAAASVAADSITVVIARRLPSTADSNKSMDSSDGNVEYLAITKVDNELYAEETTGDGSEDTNTTNTLSTVVPSRGPVGDGPPLPSMQRNPVIDRLTGTNKLYNDSYYRATHESMMEGTAQESMMMEGATDEPDGGRMVRSPVREARRGGVRSPPVIDVAQETMRIVADYDKQNAWQPPPSSRGRGTATEVSSSSLPPDVSTRAPEPPAWLINWQEESIEM